VRFFPLISAGWAEGQALTPTLAIIAFIGAFTALFAASIALAQNDVKRVLAYSTISQLGYMVAAIGIGAYVAAAFHLLTHAFFKALLFLGSGSVIHGMEHGIHQSDEHVDPQNMFNMGGLRQKMPRTFWTFLIGGLALSGFPLVTAGFWSKDEILADAFANGQIIVFVVLALAAFVTAFYTMRQITLTFLGSSRTKAAENAHESVWTMTLPLGVLAVFSIGLGWVGIPEDFPVIGGVLPNWFHDFIGGTLLEHPHAIPFSVIPLLTSLVVALGGLFLGWLVYRNVEAGQVDPLKKVLGKFYTLLQNKYYFDELYDRIIVRPAYWFAESFTSRFLDQGIIDGILHSIGRISLRLGGFLRNAVDLPIVNGTADRFSKGVKQIAFEMRLMQTGRVQAYLIVGLMFTGLLLTYLLIFNP
jgi:NADH-quinone oxidoreductase subunit L